MNYLLNKIAKRPTEIIKKEGLSALIYKIFKKSRKFFYTHYLRIKILKLKDKRYSLASLYDFVYYSCNGFINPLQIKSEILALLKRIKEQRLKYILEIGTASGGTLFLFSRIAHRDSTIISIDLPNGTFGGGYPKFKIPLYKSFSLSNQNLYLIRENSHKKKVLNQVKHILNGKKLDFLFIDGDHRYNGVSQDFNMYSPLVKKGGLIAFHDIVLFSHPIDSYGVYKFWNEIKVNYLYEELVEKWDQNKCGIGILKMQ